jgi:Ca2+-binding EF-hand superfamily protein
MSISGIGRSGGFDISKMASTIASDMVKKFDANGDGSIDKKEFVSGLAAKGVSADVAAKQFDSIDAKKTGKINQTDIESAIKAGKGGPPPGGRPPGGMPPGGAGKAGASSTASSSKTYDKKDLNQDGTVTAEEELIYDLKNSAATSADEKTTTQKAGNINVTA